MRRSGVKVVVWSGWEVGVGCWLGEVVWGSWLVLGRCSDGRWVWFGVKWDFLDEGEDLDVISKIPMPQSGNLPF